MKLVIQRVSGAAVSVGGKTVGKCGKGLVMLLGVAEGDTREECELLAKKAANLRIFTDEAGKMNLSVKDIGGEALVVSNFTLMANYRKGNRPDYLAAAKPDEAKSLYEYFIELLSREISHVGCGEFGAHMDIEISADGPVTIVMESDELKSKK